MRDLRGKEMDKYTSGEYLATHPQWHAEDSPFKAANIRTLMRRSGLSPGTIVEVGCGAGGVIADIAQYFPGAQCVGYDISADAIGLCARHAAPNLSYVRGDFSATNVRADLLISCDVLEHVEDYLGFIRMLGSRADHVILNIPLEVCVANLLLKRFDHSRELWGHLHYFTKETAIASVRHAGLEIEGHFVALGGIARADGFWQRVAAIPRKLLLAFGRDVSSMLLGGCSLMVHAKNPSRREQCDSKSLHRPEPVPPDRS
jgi:SAM-dependent methyltransferase